MTQLVKKKFEKEYNSLKNLKDKNINNNIAMTIIIMVMEVEMDPVVRVSGHLS